MNQQPRVTPRSGKVLEHWLSRFDVWPYLEEFTIDVARELRAECVSGPRTVLLQLSSRSFEHAD